MKKIITRLSIILLALFSFNAISQTTPPSSMLTIKGDIINSSTNGKAYQLYVSLPSGYNASDTTHYPVLYILDGSYSFPLSNVTRNLLDFGNEIEKIIIVSIADSASNTLSWLVSRNLDYTPTSSPADDASFEAEIHLPKGSIKSGGAAAFLNTIRTDIIPYMDMHYKTSADRGISGHSLGGLFAAWAVLHAADLFTRFGINSPSLWADKRQIFTEEKTFYQKNKILHAKIFMSVGGEEGLMVTDMNSFADALKNHYNGLSINAYVFDGETHFSVVPAMMSRMIKSLYGLKQPTKK